MENHQEIRAIIRQNLLSKFLTESVDEKRNFEIVTHVDKCLSEFADELKDMALINNHPYVRIYLECAIEKFKEDLKLGMQRFSGIDEMLLNPKMKG